MSAHGALQLRATCVPVVTEEGAFGKPLARQFGPMFQQVKSELLFRLHTVTQLYMWACSLLGMHAVLAAEKVSHLQGLLGCAHALESLLGP